MNYAKERDASNHQLAVRVSIFKLDIIFKLHKA